MTDCDARTGRSGAESRVIKFKNTGLNSVNRRLNESKIENIHVSVQTCEKLNIYRKMYVVFYCSSYYRYNVCAKSTGWKDRMMAAEKKPKKWQILVLADAISMTAGPLFPCESFTLYRELHGTTGNIQSRYKTLHIMYCTTVNSLSLARIEDVIIQAPLILSR